MLLVSLTFTWENSRKLAIRANKTRNSFFINVTNLQHNLEIWVSRQLKYELSITKNLRGKATQAFKYMSMRQGLESH